MMLCIIHAKHDSEDKQVGYWQFGCPSCMRNKIAALRADNEELRAICRDKPGHDDLDAAAFQVNMLTGALSRAEDRIAELKAALGDIAQIDKRPLGRYANGRSRGYEEYSTLSQQEMAKIAAAALKGEPDEEAGTH